MKISLNLLLKTVTLFFCYKQVKACLILAILSISVRFTLYMPMEHDLPETVIKNIIKKISTNPSIFLFCSVERDVSYILLMHISFLL